MTVFSTVCTNVEFVNGGGLLPEPIVQNAQLNMFAGVPERL